MADDVEVLAHLDEILTRRAQALRLDDDPAEVADLSGVHRVAALAEAADAFVAMGTDAPLGGLAARPKVAVLRVLRLVTEKQVAYNRALLEALRTLNGVVEELVRTTHRQIAGGAAATASTEAALDLANAELVALRAEVAELRALVTPAG